MRTNRRGCDYLEPLSLFPGGPCPPLPSLPQSCFVVFQRAVARAVARQPQLVLLLFIEQVFYIFFRPPALPPSPDGLLLLSSAQVGLLNAIGYWAQSESLMTTTASKSAFICSLAVVFVPVLDALLGAKDAPEVARAKALERAEAKRRDGGVFAVMNGPWFPALLAAAGVACLELIGVEGGPNSGDVWALVQPLW